jgi:hypothetical protein
MLKKVIQNGDNEDYQKMIDETVRQNIAEEFKKEKMMLNHDEQAYEKRVDEVTKDKPYMKQAVLLSHFMSNARDDFRGDALVEETLRVLKERLNLVFEKSDYYVYFPGPEDLYLRKDIKKETDFYTPGIAVKDFEAFAKKEYQSYFKKQKQFDTDHNDLSCYLGEKIKQRHTLIIPFAADVPSNVYGLMVLNQEEQYENTDLEKANLIGSHLYDFFHQYNIYLPWIREPQ